MLRVAVAMLVLMVAATSANGGSYACETVGRLSGHDVAIDALTDLLGEEPVEVRYCAGESPRWAARWAVFETYDGWRKFATATCFEENMRCRAERHAVAPKSYEVVDLEYDIPLPRVKELFEVGKTHHPDSEIASISYIEVTDGGAWSEEQYGYRLAFLEPPSFDGGDMERYVRDCSEVCRWVRPKRYRAGSWSPGTSGEYVRDLARERRDPLIRLLHAQGR